MPTMTSCTLNGQLIDIDTAIEMKDSASSALSFHCNECDQLVRPHRAGGHAAAHF
jgi:hypothetical protein